MQDPVHPSFLYSANHGSGHADAGNSFLALLYGSPSLLQCDFQEFSYPKPSTLSGNVTAASGNFVVDSIESGGTFLTSNGGLMTENISNHNLQMWTDNFPDISSRAMMGLSNGNNSVFHDIQSSHTAAQPTVPGGEKTREPVSSMRQCCGTNPASNLNVCSSDIHAMPNMALEQCSSKQATPSMSGCPRVFCMGKSGYLLLSNTGLLGIVCSCHCCHMSVLKFCEHSGLHGVNPGDAVHMESGETIAQWQKLYFLKFGIRSPGNESEWDWPEVLSTTGCLMKSNSSASNTPKSELSHIFSSSAVILSSGNPSDHVMFPKNVYTDHNLSIGALPRRQLTTVQDGCNISHKGFTDISPNKLHDRLNSQLMESNLATYTTYPNFVGTRRDDGCHPSPPFLDSLKRSENLSIVHSSSQIPIGLLKDHESIMNKNAKVGLVCRDEASSNVELRLGQPPQNPVQSVIEPPVFHAFVSPPKLQPLKQMTHNNLSREEALQSNFSYAAGPFNSKMIEEQPQLKHRNYMSGISNGFGAARARSETTNVAKGLVFPPVPQFNPQPECNTKASENLGNDDVPIMPKILHSGISTMHFESTNVLMNSNGRIVRQSDNSAPGSNKFMDNNKGVRCAKDSCAKINSGITVSKLMENPSSFTIPVGGSSDSCISVVTGNICESHHESCSSFDTSVGANFLCGSKMVSSLGQDNHVTLGSLGNKLASGTAIPSEGILTGIPFLVSSSTSNQNPSLPQQEGINMDSYWLNENMRLLALTQILELSKQQHALYLHEMNKKQERSSNISKVKHYSYEASLSEPGNSGAILKLPQNKGSCGNLEIAGDLDKQASLTGLYRCCRLSTLAPIPMHSKENELQCKHSCDLLNEEPSLSLGRNKDYTRSSACEKCSEQPSDTHLVGKFTHAARVNCSGSNFFSGIGPCPRTFKQQFADTSGESSLMTASKFSRDQSASKDENTYFEQGRKLDGQDSSKIGSHTPQWRDVPSKARKGGCEGRSLDQTPTVLDWEERDVDQLVNISTKRFKRNIHMEDFLKEQENSDVSSGCSAPAVTQASVEVNNVDSSTVDAVDTGYVNNLVVDEGSGINKGWSSDAVESERSAEFFGSTCETFVKKGNLRVLNDKPCRSLLDDLKLLDSLMWKKGRDQNHFMLSVNCKTSQSQKVKGFKGKKRKRTEMRMVDASSSAIPSLLHNENDESTGVDDSPFSFSKEMQMCFSSNQQRSSTKASSVQPSIKQRNSAFSSKFLSCKDHLSKHYSDKEDGHESQSNSGAEFHKFSEVSGSKKFSKNFNSDSFGHSQIQQPADEEPEKVKLKSFSSRHANAHKTTRPVVCGKYGEISSGKLAEEVPKPAKIVSLTKVLKTSKRCRVPTQAKPRPISRKKWKRLSSGASSEHYYGISDLKTKEETETQNTIIGDETNVNVYMEDTKRGNNPLVICKLNKDTKPKQGDSIIDRAHAPLKLKGKGIRKQRSISELTAKETKVNEVLQYAEDRKHGLCNTNSRKSVQEHMSVSILNSNPFCCVCGSSSNDEINCLLECSQCLLRVHQACYGISTLPKGRWCCRPCRTNSKDIACVLCGYGGGAMTRALLSRTIVKSLLKVWNIEKDGMPKYTTPCEVEKEMDAFHSSKSGLEGDHRSVLRSDNSEIPTTDLLNIEMTTNLMHHSPYSVGNFKVHNSITAGVLDSTVKQWVHMVCGLWTPGTRCPNVDTMSAFDVSGVSRPRADVVCSICNRKGGSCIECRIVDCPVKFHPWCAHQKNLLQSETEGVDDEMVGFYGRCALHVVDPTCQSKCDHIDNKAGSLEEEKEFTCSRTEGYKGRRRDGFQHNHYSAFEGKGGCLVHEEQLNAWIHINGQKLCSRGLPKFLASDIEYDCRKEYARYKQAKGWKHLIVYKSGIHALGLYTSRFISRGEMVVEYVGEIVGLRVADKRENEYQSGRKLQYKSACYFFRIDKEHIIDATRKGGIARFVNHSCLPNCVAKVITVRHEKKVVFFAERDIFPGEEITYDYHFNHEDEGKKIPCFCNSKNCRRYLN